MATISTTLFRWTHRALLRQSSVKVRSRCRGFWSTSSPLSRPPETPRPRRNSVQFGNQSRSVLSDWRFPEKIISYFSRYLRLDTTCSMETNPELEREVKFWSEVGTDQNQPVRLIVTCQGLLRDNCYQQTVGRLREIWNLDVMFSLHAPLGNLDIGKFFSYSTYSPI